ncbi:MAG: ATPase [Paracoccaceae bacterium]|nr:ATPase [Paracoccaceae bacterium]
MSESNAYNVIGVDGGGTSCRIALVLDGQRTWVKTGPANVTTDFGQAVRTISQGLREVAQKAGTTLDALVDLPAYLGLAGVLDDDMAKRVADALPLSCARIGDDRITTLTGALGFADGAVAGIGTGSFLTYRSGEDIKLIGGYGFRIGDDASGAWLGRALLQHCLHVLDGIAPASDFSRSVLEEFGGQAKRLVDFAGQATPGDFGAFAPRIFEAAGQGDASGLSLISNGVNYITAGLDALGWTPGDALCLTGGVGPHYAPFMPTEYAAALVEPQGTGLDGAIFLAQRLACENSTKKM